MLPYRDSRLTQIALAVFFLILLGYAYFEARGILFGPRIDVISSISEVHDPYIVVKGHAERISALLMNGKAIAVTENGIFEEPYVLSEGYNRITLDAKDKYGRTSKKTIEVVYTRDPHAPKSESGTTLEAPSTAPVAH